MLSKIRMILIFTVLLFILTFSNCILFLTDSSPQVRFYNNSEYIVKIAVGKYNTSTTSFTATRYYETTTNYSTSDYGEVDSGDYYLAYQMKSGGIWTNWYVRTNTSGVPLYYNLENNKKYEVAFTNSSGTLGDGALTISEQ